MNTTMAPLDQIQQRTLGVTHRSFLRRRDDDEKKERDDDNEGRGKRGDDDEEDGKNGEKKDDDDEDEKDGKKQKQAPSPPQAPAVITTTAPAIEAVPSTVVIISTTTAPPIVSTIWMTTSVIPTPSVPTSLPISTITSSSSVPANDVAASSSNAFISTMVPTMFPTSVTPIPTLPPWSQLPDPADRPRKGLDPDDRSYTSTTAMVMTATTTIWTSVVIPQTALASATISAAADQEDGYHKNKDKEHKSKDGQLSSDAEHWLIAIGAIGAFILVAAGVYLFMRMKGKKISILSTRKFGKGGPRGWYGWRRQDQDYMDNPPQYYGGYNSNEKSIPTQQHIEAFYSPGGMPPLATPGTSDALSRANSQRQEQVRQALLDNPAPFSASQYSQASSPVEQAAGLSATQAFYNIDAQNTSLGREPLNAYSNTGSQNMPASDALSDYNNTGNKNMLLTRQPGTQTTQTTSGAYDPNQREVNHMSYLSSLSSGFGDGLIMPEPTVVGGASRQTYRQSRNPGAAPGASRFSWATSVPQTPGLKGDRDTIYTTTSTDSAPRFRTVNSWVAQQAGRVDKQQQGDRDVPAMPPIPHPLQTNFPVDHQRKPSEDPAFRHHPGEEIAIERGSRVPSSILDTKTYVN